MNTKTNTRITRAVSAVFALMFALCLCISPANVQADSGASKRFVDVSDEAYYAEPVKWAIENYQTRGTDDTHFSPNQTCTRAQIVTFLYRYYSVFDVWEAGDMFADTANTNIAVKQTFVDVPEDAYYADAVGWAVNWGITKGTDATHFSPNAPCTRAQVVTFLWRYFGEKNVAILNRTFKDIPAGSYFEKPVYWAKAMGITSGKSASAFGPNDPCTRAETMTFLYRSHMNRYNVVPMEPIVEDP